MATHEDQQEVGEGDDDGVCIDGDGNGEDDDAWVGIDGDG